MPPYHHLLSRNVRNVDNTQTNSIIQNQKSQRRRTSVIKQQRKYKIGLNFQEINSAIRHSLKPSRICSYCNAKLFAGETEGICCKTGKIKLASTECNAFLKDLFTRRDNMGNEFRNNIRAYNNIFAFTSMGVKIDQNLANGSLLPNNTTPKFLQLYIYDTEHETNNRLTIIPKLRQETLEVIKSILDQYNPF
ncbi:9500_t:CDS:2, partial [Cetraspora pellucida]